MALSSLLGIARSALTTHQRGVDVAGHNIANASTDGYTRQRLRLVPATPLFHPQGMIGRGVRVDGIERPRSEFLDASFRRENASLSQFSTLHKRLADIEAVLGEPSDHGLAATLDAFWSAWSDLANNPMSGSARAVVRAQGRQLVNQFNSMSSRVDGIRGQIFEELRADVDDINRFVMRLSDLNRQIVRAGGGGNNAPDLLDERDAVIDQLGELLPVRPVRNDDGSVRVFGGDTMLLDGTAIRGLTVTNTPSGAVAVGTSDAAATLVAVPTGRIAAHLDVLENAIPQVRTQLDALVSSIVSEVNTLHRGGATVAGVPTGDFFSATGVAAATMQVAAEITLSADNIAAGSGSGPGDGSVALGVAALRDVTLASLSNLTIGDYYSSVVVELGQEVREADGFARAQDALVANAEARRSSNNDVSIDEEMVNLIVHQQAYAAAARLITVADEMIQEVLRMV